MLCERSGGAIIGPILGWSCSAGSCRGPCEQQNRSDWLLLLGSLRLNEKTAFLKAQGPFGHPGGTRHFGDEFALDVVGGFLGFHEAAQQIVVFGLIFADEDPKASA
jgi:hypothetical protein